MTLGAFETWLNDVSSFVWGPALLVLLLGVGLYLTLALRFMPILRIGTAFRLLFIGRKAKADDPGEITPFQTLMTALAATIGTGNIAGVATAIALGGPGAVFWMWMTALVGMATKYAEAVLAIHFREVDADGRHVGGPMYYIKNGLGKGWGWLAVAFALFAAIAGFGIGNMVQSNSVTQIVVSTFGVPAWSVGLVLAVLTFLVIIGGVKRIGAVAEWLVPAMALIFIAGGLTILAINWRDIPEGLAFIVRSAFTDTAATGGFAGAAVWAGIRFGVARGVFSNEAGLGSAAIAHAAAKSKDAVQQGMVAMLGTFIDTIIVCTITALVIVTVHVPVQLADGSSQMMAAWESGKTGAELSALAFAAGLPAGGHWIVTFGLMLFAFTTILGWSYYGERSAEFLFGVKVVTPYRCLWVLFVFLGSVLQLNLVWTITDILNALMAAPNLIALALLSGVVLKLTRESATARTGKI
ncbi:MAG: sodium:alanine symporter family protein [Caulobacter sp.]|nr:sodium:alanine symporter family protein [Caulobacter sp.]